MSGTQLSGTIRKAQSGCEKLRLSAKELRIGERWLRAMVALLP